MALDRIDFEILGALQTDATISNKDLAACIGTAPSTCLERVRRLKNDGILRGCHANIDEAALGIGIQAMITVRMNQNATADVDSVWNDLLNREEVVAIFHIAGADDLLVHVAVRDVEHLRNLGAETFARPEIGHIETSLIFEHATRRKLPNYNTDQAAQQ